MPENSNAKKVCLECRSNYFYEIVVDGEPTGQGSFDFNEANEMKRQMEEEYEEGFGN